MSSMFCSPPRRRPNHHLDCTFCITGSNSRSHSRLTAMSSWRVLTCRWRLRTTSTPHWRCTPRRRWSTATASCSQWVTPTQQWMLVACRPVKWGSSSSLRRICSRDPWWTWVWWAQLLCSRLLSWIGCTRWRRPLRQTCRISSSTAMARKSRRWWSVQTRWWHCRLIWWRCWRHWAWPWIGAWSWPSSTTMRIVRLCTWSVRMLRVCVDDIYIT